MVANYTEVDVDSESRTEIPRESFSYRPGGEGRGDCRLLVDIVEAWKNYMKNGKSGKRIVMRVRVVGVEGAGDGRDVYLTDSTYQE